ncbi:hypothetical protein DFJ74DRAFT_324345 [Hyaloraphidium curvatum]|nr:hypothetical protein DFJ74DRAFT_324345 [Hyaloraphidium curvatum]
MALEVELLSEFIPFGYSYAKETQTLSGKVPSNPVSLPALDLGVRRPGSSDALRENVPSLTGCYALSEVRAFASDGRTRLQGAEARGVVGEEELYVVGTTVICSRGCHGCVGSDGKEHVDGHAVITATFNFEHLRQPIRQVLWAWFAPTMELSDDFVGSRESTSPVAEKQAVGNGPSRFPAERSCLDRALCVLFRDFAVFQFDDGRSFTANMSFVVQRAFALDGPSGGLLLQKAKSDERGPDLEANTEPGPLDSVPGSLFTLMHPLEEPRTVSVLSEVPSIVVSDASGSRAATGVPFDDFDEHVVFVSASGAAPDPTCLIVSHNAVSGKHSVWTYVHRVLGDSERNSLFPPLRRPSMASASDSLVDGVPQATSPSLGGASSSKASGSARRQSKAKKVQLAHAPKRPSLLSLHAETPDLSREFGVVEASVRRSSVEPAGVVDGDDEEYHKAVTTWQTAPVVSLIKLWEQNASSATPTSSSACVTHTSSGEEVLTLFNLERRSMLSLLVSKTAGAGPSEQPRQVRVNHLFSLDACSVAPVYATRTARRDLLILKTDWALSLWAGDMERGDSGAVQPVFIPCEVPYNFQERIPSRESSKAALRPIVKKRRRDASGDTSDSDGGGMNEGDGAESASTNAPSSASKADAAADGDDKVLRSPARSSRVVGLTDPVGSRVNFVLSNGIVIRAALDYTDRQGRLVSLVLEALAHALPERHYSMFWHRFLKLQYGGAAKIVPYGAGPAIPGESGFAEGNSDWDNLLVAFFSFCHLTPRKRPGMQPRPSTDHGAAHGHEPPRDGPVASWNRLLSTDFHCRLRDDPIFRNFALVAPTATQTAGHGTPRLLRLFELSREVYVQNYTDTTFCGSYGTLLSALHLVYEDLKVDVLTQGEIRRLVQLLFQLAVAASSRDHDDHYRRDGFAPDAIVPLESE